MGQKKYSSIPNQTINDNTKVFSEFNSILDKFAYFEATTMYSYIRAKLISLASGANMILKTDSTGNALEGMPIQDILKLILTADDTYIVREAGNIIAKAIPVIKYKRNFISGYVLSITGTTITVGEGDSRNENDTFDIVFNGMTKNFTVFAAGNGNGCYDADEPLRKDTIYYIFNIANKTAPVLTDVLISRSINPSLPTGYDTYRLIGTFLTDANQIPIKQELNNFWAYYENGANGYAYPSGYISDVTIDYIDDNRLNIHKFFARNKKNDANIKSYDTRELNITTNTINASGSIVSPTANTQYYIIACIKIDYSGLELFATDTFAYILPADYKYGIMIGEFKTRTDAATIWELSISDIHEKANKLQMFSVSGPLTGIVDTRFYPLGENRLVISGQTSDYATAFGVSNNRVSLKINSLTGSDEIIISGTKRNKITGVPQTGETEKITVDTIGDYITNAEFIEVTNIEIGAGITAINYNVYVVGFVNVANSNATLVGYSLDLFTQSGTADMSIQITKITDKGDNKIEFTTLEHLGFDSGAGGNQIIDHLRTGADDRSYNPAASQIVPNNGVIMLSAHDFNLYFTNYENIIKAKNKNEGIMVRYDGEGGGITNIDNAVLTLFYREFNR